MADFERAVAEAAELLARSSLPVIAGHIADAASASAAFRLANAAGGVVDHAAAEAVLRDHAVLADIGSMLVSPGEARQRGDIFLLVGDGPAKAWPDLPGFLLAESPPGISERIPKRSVLALCQAEPDAWSTADEVLWRRSERRAIPGILAALRARIAGHPVATTVDRKELDGMVDTLKAARFGVAVWSAGELDAMALETLTGLVKDLNAETRWSSLSVAEDGGAVAATLVAGWTTGFPLRTGFGQGYPEHDPWRFEARRLVESGEADAIVWIAVRGEPAPDWLAGIPTVELSSRPGGSQASPAVGISVGVAGVDHDAVLYDRRAGTLVRLAGDSSSGLPGVAVVLDRIAALLP